MRKRKTIKGDHLGVWDNARVARLRDLLDQHHTGGQIAKIMGLTRNQILGKVHRMGWELPETSKRSVVAKLTKTRDTSKAARAPKSKPAAFEREPMPTLRHTDVGRKLLTDLETGECHFPVGEGPFKFCALEAVPGLPYCPEHASRCYVPVPVRPLSKPLQDKNNDASDKSVRLVTDASEIVVAGE